MGSPGGYQPSIKDLALLRRLHAPFADEPLASLSSRMKRAPHFSFRVPFLNSQSEQRFLSALANAGIAAVVAARSEWEVAWPPAHVAVERFADMWQSPHRFVLAEDGDESTLHILTADQAAYVLIEEGADLLAELTKRMRDAGVPVVRSSHISCEA